MIENMEKKVLDSKFLFLNGMTRSEMENLAAEYEALKKNLANQLQDIADRTEMIYRFLRNADHGDLR